MRSFVFYLILKIELNIVLVINHCTVCQSASTTPIISTITTLGQSSTTTLQPNTTHGGTNANLTTIEIQQSTITTPTPDATDPILCQKSILLFSNSSSIKFLETATGRQVVVVSNQSLDIISIDYHITKNLVYWSDGRSSSVFRKLLLSMDEGTEDVVISGGQPLDIAVDSINDHVYWIDDTNSGRIMRSDLDGSQTTTIFAPGSEGSFGFKAIELDIANGWIYYISSVTHIGRCDLDGRNDIDIIRRATSDPYRLAVDLTKGRLFWTGNYPDVIQSANNNGFDIQSIFEYPESFQNPQYYGIDIDVCNVFFSDWQNGIFKISRFNGSTDNGTVSTPVINETSVNGLKLYRGYQGIIQINDIVSDGEFYEGSVVKFTCIADVIGSIRNVTVEWKLNKATVNPTSKSRWKTEEIPGDPQRRQYQLTVEPIRIGDSGTISCNISEGAQQSAKKLDFSVIGKPVVSISPLTTVVHEGDTVTIHCSIVMSFSVNVSIVWYQDGAIFQTMQDEGTGNTTQYMLTISEIQESATFECLGRNVAGEGNRVRSQITVIKPSVCYKYCPKHIDDFNTTWMSSINNNIVIVPCMGLYTGAVTRYCNNDGLWDDPDYTACIRNDIQDLYEKSENIQEGVEVSAVETILTELTNLTSANNNDVRSGDLEISSSILKNMADFVSERPKSLSAGQLETFVDSCSTLLEDRHASSWKQLKIRKLNGITRLVQAVTTYSKAYTSVNTSEFNTLVQRDNIVVQVGRTMSKDLIFPDRSQMLPTWIMESTTKVKLNNANINGVEPVGYSSTYYRNISDLFHQYLVADGNLESFTDTNVVNSVVVDFSIETLARTLDPPLIAEFQHLTMGYSSPVCVFWNFSIPDTPNGAWSTSGSRLASNTNISTICQYDHTTNFAILMSPGNTPAKDLMVLSVLSIVGCGISILFLVITVFVHALLWSYLKSDRAIILVNLCVALLLSYTLFLGGVTRTENKDVCSAIAVSLHYVFLVVFTLMAAEGIEIAISVTYVFSTASRSRWLVPASWVIPAIIVGISAGITRLDGYGNINFCWLSLESGLLWAFAGPALLVILINIIILILILRVMFKSRAMMTKTTKEKGRAGIRSICVVLPLFGITWIFGIFSVNEELVIFQYLFSIFNSLQGFMIFIFHCLLNQKVREGIQHIIRKRRSAMYEDSRSSTEHHKKKTYTIQTDDNPRDNPNDNSRRSFSSEHDGQAFQIVDKQKKTTRSNKTTSQSSKSQSDNSQELSVADEWTYIDQYGKHHNYQSKRYGGDHYNDNFDIDIDMEDISMQYMGNRPFVRSRETRPNSSNYYQNDRTSWS